MLIRSECDIAKVLRKFPAELQSDQCFYREYEAAFYDREHTDPGSFVDGVRVEPNLVDSHFLDIFLNWLDKRGVMIGRYAEVGYPDYYLPFDISPAANAAFPWRGCAKCVTKMDAAVAAIAILLEIKLE